MVVVATQLHADSIMDFLNEFYAHILLQVLLLLLLLLLLLQHVCLSEITDTMMLNDGEHVLLSVMSDGFLVGAV